jgi:NADP-dependent 3-hydroxy acid dehydrogenase YdfG
MVSSQSISKAAFSVVEFQGQPDPSAYLIFVRTLSMVGLSEESCESAQLRRAINSKDRPEGSPMSIFDLTGRVAVVTGGNGGIGLGIAQALASSGCNVSIWGRNADKNHAAAASLAAGPGQVDSRVCDVTSPASVNEAMKATLDTFGRVDGCFANAGIGGGGRKPFIERTEEEWRTMFATNLDGVFHAFQAAAKHMTARAETGDPFGRLVATSSLASLFGTARNEHYAATKAAINALVPRAGGRAGALRRHRQCDPARLDQERHDRRPDGQRQIHGRGGAAHSDAPLRQAGGFRRHRRLSDEQGLVLSHRRYFRDRRRLHRLLGATSKHEQKRGRLGRAGRAHSLPKTPCVHVDVLGTAGSSCDVPSRFVNLMPAAV